MKKRVKKLTLCSLSAVLLAQGIMNAAFIEQAAAESVHTKVDQASQPFERFQTEKGYDLVYRVLENDEVAIYGVVSPISGETFDGNLSVELPDSINGKVVKSVHLTKYFSNVQELLLNPSTEKIVGDYGTELAIQSLKIPNYSKISTIDMVDVIDCLHLTSISFGQKVKLTSFFQDFT